MRPDEKPMREKTWEERTADEKCQELRYVVKNLYDQVQRQQQFINELLTHEHTVNGIVSPLKPPVLEYTNRSNDFILR